MIALAISIIVMGFVIVLGGLVYEVDGLIFTGMAVIVGGLIFVLVVALNSSDREHDRLMRQCMADGNPEYKCVSILRRPDTTVIPMPIVIPR